MVRTITTPQDCDEYRHHPIEELVIPGFQTIEVPNLLEASGAGLVAFPGS